MTDCACTAKIKHIILLENGGRLCMNSIHPKTKLLNAQDQPSGAGVENSAKLIQILCDRCTASAPQLSTQCMGDILELVILISYIYTLINVPR